MTPTQTDCHRERQSLLRGLISDDIAAIARDVDQEQPAAHPVELAGLSPRAVEKRRREFTAGRAAVKTALIELGHPPDPVPVGPDRAPIWPRGVTGSITHTKGFAAAIVAKTSVARALGLDAERATPLKSALHSEILSPSEHDWTREQADPDLMAKLIFSAKEAAYKAQFTLSGRYFGFSGMETRWSLASDTPNSGAFTATFTRDAAPFTMGVTLSGRFVIGAGLILTFVELRG